MRKVTTRGHHLHLESHHAMPHLGVISAVHDRVFQVVYLIRPPGSTPDPVNPEKAGSCVRPHFSADANKRAVAQTVRDPEACPEEPRPKRDVLSRPSPLPPALEAGVR